MKDEKCDMATRVIDIPAHKAGMLRSNQKFCFPCDNSVIRVDKHTVGGRRFGASVIIKDNMVFGIQENEDIVMDKVPGEDELFNQETKRASNRNCRFWLEFENKARLQISMLDPVEPQRDMIPPQSAGDVRTTAKRAELGTITSRDSLEQEPTGAAGDDRPASRLQKSSIADGAVEKSEK